MNGTAFAAIWSSDSREKRHYAVGLIIRSNSSYEPRNPRRKAASELTLNMAISLRHRHRLNNAKCDGWQTYPARYTENTLLFFHFPNTAQISICCCSCTSANQFLSSSSRAHKAPQNDTFHRFAFADSELVTIAIVVVVVESRSKFKSSTTLNTVCWSVCRSVYLPARKRISSFLPSCLLQATKAWEVTLLRQCI